MTRLGWLVVVLALAVVCACGGDSGPTATISPIGTKAATPTPVPGESDGPTGAAVPTPAEPTLDEALTELASGDFTPALGPGETFDIDPETLVEGAPSCTNFEFDFTWQVVDPYPPDGVALQWVLDRDNGDTVTISDDTAGEQSVGCSTVHAVNTGGSEISVAIKYKIGGLS